LNAAHRSSAPSVMTQDLEEDSGPVSGSTSLRSPEPVPVSALSGNDPGYGLYRSEGVGVFQDGKCIATCFTGHQGQAADIIASRIAALLNKDFEQFCIDVAAHSQSTGETK
jgi:hypothetical protein